MWGAVLRAGAVLLAIGTVLAYVSVFAGLIDATYLGLGLGVVGILLMAWSLRDRPSKPI